MLLFSVLTYFLSDHNYLFYLFDVVTFFDEVRITLYFDMFELHMATTLQLRFVFARHCNIFSLRHSYVIHLFVVVTFFLMMFYFGMFELGMEITLQLRYVFARHCDVVLLRHKYVINLFVIVTFLMTLELRNILVCSNYVLKLCYKKSFFSYVCL